MMTARRPHRWLRASANLALIALLLTAVSFLPPDTSLRDRQRAGVLKVCVPPSYPPLVTGDPQRPGYDVELTQAIAEEMGLRLSVNVLPSIGRDFNPRNWMLTRAQCDIIAGGLADTEQTRGFLQTIPTAVETGWVGVSRDGALPDAGGRIVVLPGTSGLDRITLSSWLRAQSLQATPARSAEQFRNALLNGEADAGITERLVADGLTPDGFSLFWLPERSFQHYRMAIGLWKGDQTLKRAVDAAMEKLETSGALAVLDERYGLSMPVAPDPAE